MRSNYDSGFNRQLRSGLAQSFAGNRLLDSINLKNNSSRQDGKAVALRVPLAFAHADLRGLGSIRPVGENANPVFAGLGQSARNNLSGGLDLRRPDASPSLGLQAIGAERKGGASSIRSYSLWISTHRVPLSKFYFFRY
jgi:hypothetical protein